MPTVPALTHIAKENFQDAPEYFGRFLDQVNPFLGDTAAGLEEATRRQRQVESFELTTRASLATTFSDAKVTLKNKLPYKPTSVTIGRVFCRSTAITAVIGPPIWDYQTNGLIRIDYIAGLSTSTTYELTLIVE